MKNIQFFISSLDNPRNYNCFLLDDILLHILNYVHDIRMSLVSYQFYTVNRDFVVKCYHLHHYIPTIKEIIDQSSICPSQVNKSPHIISIQFDSQISILKFNNMNDLLPNNIHVTSNIITTLGTLLQDPYIQCKLCFISTENESKNGNYVSLLELLDLVAFNKVIAANKLNLIKTLSSNYITIHEMVDAIINCLDINDQPIFLNYLNKSSEKGTGKTFDQFIPNISPKKLEEFLYGMIDISNTGINIFDINKNNTILVPKIYDNPTIPIYNKDALPEYQWIVDQL